jgi:hypothetical protein
VGVRIRVVSLIWLSVDVRIVRAVDDADTALIAR